VRRLTKFERAWFAALSLSLLLSLFMFAGKVDAQLPSISMLPPPYDVWICTDFTVAVSVDDVVDLGEWVISLDFNPTMMKCLRVEEAPFFWPESTSFMYEIDNGIGRLLAACGLWPTPPTQPPVSGSGIIMYITFHCIGPGECLLHLHDTSLMEPMGPIVHETHDCYVVQHGPSYTYDVSVKNVTTCKTLGVQGYDSRVKVTVKNEGTIPIVFNLTAYANGTAIGKQEITLIASEVSTVTFLWNNASCALGNYTFSAYADTDPCENDVADNTYAGGLISMIPIPDLNEDGKVDLKEVYYVGRRYGSHEGNPLYDPNADIADDGKIDLKDYFAVCKNFGKTYP
jgi:hypothetical protein